MLIKVDFKNYVNMENKVMNKLYRKKLKNSWCFILIFLIGFAFFIDAILLVGVKNNIENQNVVRKFCSYELKEIRTGRNISYLFILEDAEKIFVVDELLENNHIIDSHEKLLFTYVAPRSGIHFAYTCLEITSHEESIQFVNRATAFQEVKIGILVDFLIAIPMLLFSFVPFVFDCILISSRTNRKKKKVKQYK